MYTHLRELEEASHVEDEYGDSLHNTCPNPKILYKQSVNYAQSLRTSLNISPTLNRPTQRYKKIWVALELVDVVNECFPWWKISCDFYLIRGKSNYATVVSLISGCK